jgi:hypothetical protein
MRMLQTLRLAKGRAADCHRRHSTRSQASYLTGFGLPTSRLAARLEVVSQPLPRLRFRIETQGWLTDVDGVATVMANQRAKTGFPS